MSKILEKLNTDRILSVCAILIGVMTLIVYYVQTKVLISQQHAGVWPCLEVNGTNYGTNTKEIFKVNVTNKGIGPAIIKKVEIKYKGKIYRKFSDLFNVTFNSDDFINQDLEGRTMSPNETINPLQVPLSTQGKEFAKIFYGDSLSYKIFYQSVYGTCFVIEDYLVKELPDCSALEEKK